MTPQEHREAALRAMKREMDLQVSIGMVKADFAQTKVADVAKLLDSLPDEQVQPMSKLFIHMVGRMANVRKAREDDNPLAQILALVALVEDLTALERAIKPREAL